MTTAITARQIIESAWSILAMGLMVAAQAFDLRDGEGVGGSGVVRGDPESCADSGGGLRAVWGHQSADGGGEERRGAGRGEGEMR